MPITWAYYHHFYTFGASENTENDHGKYSKTQQNNNNLPDKILTGKVFSFLVLLLVMVPLPYQEKVKTEKQFPSQYQLCSHAPIISSTSLFF